MKKKVFLFSLILSALMCVFAVSAFAADITVDHINYTTDGTNAYFNADAPTDGTIADVVIPEKITYDGVEYTVVGAKRGASWPDDNEIINSVQKVTLPATVTSVPNHIFRNYKGLTYVRFLGEISTFNDAEFYQCTALKEVVFDHPDKLVKFGGYTFEGCSSLTTVAIPSNITYIGGNAFKGCSSLVADIYLPNLTNLGSYAFNGCALLSSVKIGGIFAIIPNACFYGCSGATFFDLSGATSLTTIEKNAFRDCISAKSIIIPNGPTSIAEYVFNNCNALESFIIPSTVQTISYNVWQKCSSLTSIVIPNSVTSIGDTSFQGCSKLSSVTLSNSLVSLGCNSFQSTNVTRVVLPATLKTTAKDMFHGSTLAEIVIASSDVSGYTSSLLSNTPVTLVFFAGSDPTTLTSQISQLSAWTTFVTYEQHLKNIKDPTFTGYSAKTIVYGTKNCTGCSDIDTSEFKFDFISFTEKMYDRKACQECGYVDTTAGVVEYAPIFVIKGYTVEEGTDSSSMAFGFTLNKDSIAKYETETGITLSYGLIVGSAEGNTDGKIIDKDGTSLLKSTITTKLSSATLEKFTIYNIKLTEIKTESQKALSVFCNAYIISGESIVYIGEEESDKATAVSYNSLK